MMAIEKIRELENDKYFYKIKRSKKDWEESERDFLRMLESMRQAHKQPYRDPEVPPHLQDLQKRLRRINRSR